MLPTGSDPRALRAKLISYLGNVKQFFEATSVGFNPNVSPYWSAFDALRRNKPLAEEFVSQLQTLLEFLDREMIPALAQAPARVSTPPVAEKKKGSALPLILGLGVLVLLGGGGAAAAGDSNADLMRQLQGD